MPFEWPQFTQPAPLDGVRAWTAAFDALIDLYLTGCAESHRRPPQLLKHCPAVGAIRLLDIKRTGPALTSRSVSACSEFLT